MPPPPSAATAVHVLSQFQQPYTQTPTSPNYIPLEVAGQNLPDPTIAYPAARYAGFADKPLFGQGPAYNDIAQGDLGDCYFLASLAGYARTNPQLVHQMITSLGDGTYAVRFYYNGHEEYYRLDADLPVTSYGDLAYAGLGDNGTLWAPLMEKAFAYFRTGQNSYDSLNGGWMSDVYLDVANATSASWSTTGKTPQTVYTTLSQSLAAGKNVTAGSRSSSIGPIIGGHAYTIMSVEYTDGQYYVTVYNPWGKDGKAYDSNPNDGLLRLTATQFITSFSTVLAG